MIVQPAELRIMHLLFKTVTLAESDDEIIEIEQNQVTAHNAMSSIGLIRRFLANQGSWPHMSSLQNIEDFIACQRQQNMRQTTLIAYFCDRNAN